MMVLIPTAELIEEEEISGEDSTQDQNGAMSQEEQEQNFVSLAGFFPDLSNPDEVQSLSELPKSSPDISNSPLAEPLVNTQTSPIEETQPEEVEIQQKQAKQTQPEQTQAEVSELELRKEQGKKLAIQLITDSREHELENLQKLETILTVLSGESDEPEDLQLTKEYFLALFNSTLDDLLEKEKSRLRVNDIVRGSESINDVQTQGMAENKFDEDPEAIEYASWYPESLETPINAQAQTVLKNRRSEQAFDDGKTARLMLDYVNSLLEQPQETQPIDNPAEAGSSIQMPGISENGEVTPGTQTKQEDKDKDKDKEEILSLL